MAMRDAYPPSPAHALRGLAPALFAGVLMLPGAALAGVPVDANGQPLSAGLGQLVGLGPFFFTLTLILAIAIPLLMALNWGAQALWKAVFKTQPPFGFNSASAISVAILLGAFGMLVIPAFSRLFESFGADLPWQTRLVLDYHYLLLAPAVLLVSLLYALKAHARRERYFAVVLAGECLMLVIFLVALYSPIFAMGEAVS